MSNINYNEDKNKISYNVYNKKSTIYYLKTSIAGTTLGIFSFILSHPIDVIKTQLQSNVHLKQSAITTLKQIYYKQGILGIYRGSFPNFIRYSSRNLYRWPLMAYLPACYNKYTSKIISKLLTGLTIANLECLILTPFERLKTFLITEDKRGKKPLLNFIKSNKFTEYFRGLKHVLVKQNVSWCSFLIFDHIFKNYFINKNYSVLKKQNIHCKKSDINLSFNELNKISFFVAFLNTLFVMPFDYVKTNIQKEKYILESNNIFKFLKYTINNYGLKSIFTGFQFKIIHYIVQAVFQVNLFYRIEKDLSKK